MANWQGVSGSEFTITAPADIGSGRAVDAGAVDGGGVSGDGSGSATHDFSGSAFPVDCGVYAFFTVGRGGIDECCKEYRRNTNVLDGLAKR